MPMDTFYFPETDKHIIASIKKIAKDDGRSKSKMIMLILQEYSKRYTLNSSNQQSLIDLTDIGQKSEAYLKSEIVKVLENKYQDRNRELNYKIIVQEVRKNFKDSKLIAEISHEIAKILIDKGFKILR